MSTIVVHSNASGMYPSWNATFVVLANFSTSRCLGLSPWLPLLSMSSGVLPSWPMVLPPGPPVVYALQLQSPLLPEACPQYLLYVTVLVLALPQVGSACRYPPSGLRFVSVPLWWGEFGDPWLIRTTSVSWFILPSTVHSPLVTQSLSPLSSRTSCPPSVLLGTFSLLSCAFAGSPCVSVPVPSSNLLASRLHMRSFHQVLCRLFIPVTVTGFYSHVRPIIQRWLGHLGTIQRHWVDPITWSLRLVSRIWLILWGAYTLNLGYISPWTFRLATHLVPFPLPCFPLWSYLIHMG